MWSKHLAGGYYDHPPAVAYVIRAGTTLAGDTELGVRLVSILLALLMASSFVLFFLAKVLETGRGVWWLAVGVAVGAALLSKYTALFFGPAILLWLVAVPKLRHWLISPW